MSQKIFYEELPTPVVITEQAGGYLAVSLALNPVEKEVDVQDDNGEVEKIKGWECDTHKFVVSTADYSREAIEAHPEAFLDIDPIADAALKTAITDAVQARMDSEAAAHGYDSILSAVSYAGDTHPIYGPEGTRCKEWRSECWQYCLQLLNDVMQGKRPRPTIEEVLAGLPPVNWPTIR